MQKDLTKPGVTLYKLWEEYILEHPDGYQHTQFRVYYKKWRGHTNVSMRIERKAGDKMEVDYTGKKLEVIDKKTGEVHQSEVFVSIYFRTCSTQLASICNLRN
ncbi:MAG: hypothetical protein HRT71_19715 [Flavobacteriales bacterium]|nr:hypothetical protein [Flavobacteriales bacterium]